MESLVDRLKKRASIRRQIATRKSVQEGAPDRIADLLEEAAAMLEEKESAIENLRLSRKILKEQNQMLYKAATDWMNDYQKLKDKYEPMILVTSEALGENAGLKEALEKVLLKSELDQLLDLTKCNDLQEVAELFVEMRDK